MDAPIPGSDVGPLTAGLDIGTTSVKGVAVDGDGAIVARIRIPHRVLVPAPELLEHDADAAWRRGPRRALAGLGSGLGSGAGSGAVTAVAVSAMVPSLTAVDSRGRPISPGLLYGDARGRTSQAGLGPGSDGEAVEFLRWSAQAAPEAHGYWSAPAVASRALGGAPVVDFAVAFTTSPLFGKSGWDPDICSSCGVETTQLPGVEMMGVPIGRLGGDGPLLATGSVDAMCEQLVSGADEEGDVHVLCGTTLITWAVVSVARQVPGLWTIPHTLPGRHLVGGASNAGGMFLSWVKATFGRPRQGEVLNPGNIPVWLPYLRGERTPLHLPGIRGTLSGLDLTHGPGAIQRAAWEASGFVVRHLLDLAGVQTGRIVATGGGTRVAGWMQSLADATGLPVHVAAVPEGAAQGAAFLARMAAGMETNMLDASRWARTSHIVEPDPAWARPTMDRYLQFRELTASAARPA